ncbi:uncharacterized protein LOC142587245 [Dermacentor variabilis]|uniref:uncharacterized protein LOC142587245 n=1 Tax=Dermacentor variabilis TaxID=34621 RepID=UPI003F5BA9A6
MISIKVVIGRDSSTNLEVGSSCIELIIVLGVAYGLMWALMWALRRGLNLAGFTPAGVAAGSLAAFLQSTVGPFSAGSMFAVCQSLGASGPFRALQWSVFCSLAGLLRFLI